MDTQELQNKIDELSNRFDEKEKEFNDLKNLFDFHKHTGIDKSTKIIQAESGSTIYGGYIASDGTANAISTGWTSSRTSTGQYTVTHNLGSTDYSVTLAVLGGGTESYPVLGTVGVNSFNVITWDFTDATVDRAFMFLLMEL